MFSFLFIAFINWTLHSFFGTAAELRSAQMKAIKRMKNTGFPVANGSKTPHSETLPEGSLGSFLFL